MVHWYPQIGNNSNGANLVAAPGNKINLMINGTTAGVDTGTNAGIRDSLATWGIPNAPIMITEFNYMGSLQSGIANAANSLFVADSYASWLDNGVTSVQYLELSQNGFVGDTGSLTRGSSFWAIKMLNLAEDPGDSALSTTSSSSSVRVHSYKRADGSVAVMLLNEGTTAASVDVSINGHLLSHSGTLYSSTGTGITTASATGLGNSFNVASIPGRTLYTYIIPQAFPPAGDYNGNGIVDAADYTVWRDSFGQAGPSLAADGTGPGGTPDGVVDDLDYQFWVDHFGTASGSGAGSQVAVPEPNTRILIVLGSVFLIREPLTRCGRRAR
jgi:hypothetical protein